MHYGDLLTRFFNELAIMRSELEFLDKWRKTGAKSIWTCRDGQQIRICDMDDKHLDNTIKLLDRKCPNSDALTYLRIEKRYRSEYKSLKRNIAKYERISNLI